jgi:hypothetical protein
VVATCISPKRFDEIILDFYQDAGIWIVIASCVAEYLLLLTYIGVAAYDFFKNRKMMKKMNLKPKYSLIHYLEKDDLDLPGANIKSTSEIILPSPDRRNKVISENKRTIEVNKKKRPAIRSRKIAPCKLALIRPK